MSTHRSRRLNRGLSWGLSGVLHTIAVVSSLPLLLAAPAETGPARPITATWRGVPLQVVATRLSDLSGLPILIDRRIDPSRLVSLEAAQEPLADLLARIAAEIDVDYVVLDSHARFAPAGTAVGLRAAAVLRRQELRSLSPEDRRIALARAAWSWPDAARPRDLVVEAATTAGIGLDGVDQLPHDHFPAARLPAMSLADRLDLVLAHFDRRLSWRRRGDAAGRPTFSVVPIEAAASGGAVEPPPAKRPADGPRTPPPAAAARGPQPTYSLAVAAPLDELLGALAKRFGLRLEVDQKAVAARGIAVGEIVRRSVKDATRGQLLDAILEPLDLGWRIDDGRLLVGEPERVVD